MSPEALRLALDKTEESIWRYMRYDRKGHTVYIVELPSFEHETPGGEILRQIVKAETLAGVPDNQCCEILSSPRKYNMLIGNMLYYSLIIGMNSSRLYCNQFAIQGARRIVEAHRQTKTRKKHGWCGRRKGRLKQNKHWDLPCPKN